jgi:plastocyanin
MRIPSCISRTLLISTLIVAALALASCGDDDDEATTPAGGGATTTETESTAPDTGANAPAPSGNAVRAEKVEIVEFAYDPDPVTIEEGGKVTWINRDSVSHTASSEDEETFDTGTLDEGKLKSETFKEPGTYPYYCEIHPSMHGTVEVVPSG